MEQIAQWQDRLEVTERSGTYLVVISDGADFRLDLGQAHVAGGVGYSLEVIPDNWVSTRTPWVPALVLAAGLILWLPAVLRGRAGQRGSADPVFP